MTHLLQRADAHIVTVQRPRVRVWMPIDARRIGRRQRISQRQQRNGGTRQPEPPQNVRLRALPCRTLLLSRWPPAQRVIERRPVTGDHFAADAKLESRIARSLVLALNWR